MENCKRQISENLSRPAKKPRVTIPLEDVIEITEDEDLDLAMSQNVEKVVFESESKLNYEMSQIDIPYICSFIRAVFNKISFTFN